MKHYHLLTRLALMIASAAISLGAHAQQIHWEPTPGPYGRPTATLLVTGTGSLIASTDMMLGSSRMYRSTDRGADWTRSDSGMMDGALRLALHPGGNIAARANHNALYYSTDDGISWNPATIDKPNPYISCFAVAPNGTMYAGGMSGFISFSSGVFRSIDGGRTWHYLSLEGMNVEALLADSDSTLIAAINGSGDIASPSIQRSTDGGATWSIVTDATYSSGNGVEDFIIDSTHSYWAVRSSGPWRSTDHGEHWDSVASPFHYPAAGLSSMEVMQDGTIIAGTNMGPFRSTDNGITWQPVNGWPEGAEIIDLTGALTSDLYAATNSGIYRSTDNGITWSETNHGIPSAVIALTAGGSGHLLAKAYSGVQLSNDGGNQWRWKGFANDYPNTVAVTAHGDYFVGTNTGKLYRSTDGGTTWKSTQPSSALYMLGVGRNGDLFAAMSGDTVFRSTDNGTTWSSAPIECSGYEINGFGFDSLQSGYAATSRGIFKTTDNGSSWSGAVNTAPTTAIAMGHIDHSGIAYAATNDGVIRSTDGGSSWINPSTIVRNHTSLAVDIQGSIFAATADSGVYLSTDRGISWSNVSAGLTDSNVTSLAISTEGGIYAGTLGGVFRIATSLGVERPETESNDLSLVKISPNPFSERTAINFRLPSTEYTSLVISNSLGETIATLISGRLGAGEHTLVWNASGHTAGVYFYTLRSGTRQVTGKMVISR